MSNLDTSEFEAQFEDPDNPRYNNLMPNDDFERLAFLNVRIDDIENERDLLKDDIDRLELDQAIINGELNELRRRVEELLNKRRPIDDAIARTNQIGRHNKTNKEAYERERARLLQELASRQRLLAMRDAVDASTENKPWRIGRAKDGKKALPHQLEGAHRLVSANRALLGDKPGLGKTLEAIITIDMLRVQGKAKKVLIFTPKSVLKDFERAFSLWTDPTFIHVLNQTLKGIKSELLDMLIHFPEAIVITNYEVWRKDKSIHAKLIECGFDTIILDEAHLLKNFDSATSKSVRELVYAENKCPQCGGANFSNRGFDKFCLSCEFVGENFGDFCSIKNVYPMTGTPVLNKPHELFPLLNLIDREGFPREKNFLDDYCKKEYDYRANKWVYTFGDGGSARLMKKLGLKYTARTRESAGVIMPPQEVKHHWLELDPEKYPRQANFVKRLRDEARLVFSEDHQLTQYETLAWYTRMRQAASWPDAIEIKGCPHDPKCLHYDEEKNADIIKCPTPEVIFPPKGAPPIGESVMMDAATDIIFESVEDGDRIVVFSMYRKVLFELERRCREAGLRHGVIVGGVPDKKRQELIDDFNTNHTPIGQHQYDVLLCQYATGDTGLNLNGAQQLLCVERQWNPGKEEQTLDRVRRLDSEFNSIVHILHCEGTATELIDAIIDQKQAMLDGLQADVDLAEAMRKFLEG